MRLSAHMHVSLPASVRSLRWQQCKSSILTVSVVLLWCERGSYLAAAKAIRAPLRIMRQEYDPYLKVNISSCPCRSPSLLSSLLRYR